MLSRCRSVAFRTRMRSAAIHAGATWMQANDDFVAHAATRRSDAHMHAVIPFLAPCLAASLLLPASRHAQSEAGGDR